MRSGGEPCAREERRYGTSALFHHPSALPCTAHVICRAAAKGAAPEAAATSRRPLCVRRTGWSRSAVAAAWRVALRLPLPARLWPRTEAGRTAAAQGLGAWLDPRGT